MWGRIVRLSDSDEHEYVRPEMASQTHLSASVDQAMMPDKDRISTDNSHDDQPRSALGHGCQLLRLDWTLYGMRSMAVRKRSLRKVVYKPRLSGP